VTSRSRRSRWALWALTVSTTVSLGLGGFVVYGARATHPVGVDDALRRYAERPTYAGRSGVDSRPIGVRPAAGVYLYATVGSARVDLLGIDRRYPATTSRIIRHGPGCQWEEEVPILLEHVEAYSACAADGDQLDTGYSTRLTYFFVVGVSDAACAPTGTRTGYALGQGTSRAFRCLDASRGVRTDGTATFLGDDTVDVAGHATACRRVRIVTVMSGTTNGAAVRELCSDATSGLLLHETRTVGLTVESAFVGLVRYVESAEFVLRSTTPQR